MAKESWALNHLANFLLHLTDNALCRCFARLNVATGNIPAIRKGNGRFIVAQDEENFPGRVEEENSSAGRLSGMDLFGRNVHANKLARRKDKGAENCALRND